MNCNKLGPTLFLILMPFVLGGCSGEPTLTGTDCDDPVERAILEQIPFEWQAQRPYMDQQERQHFQSLLAHLSTNRHVVYVIDTHCPVWTDKDPNMYESISSKPGQVTMSWMKSDEDKNKHFAKGMARVITGQYSVGLDRSTLYRLVQSYNAGLQDEARRTNYMTSSIPRNWLRVRNQDPLLESYGFAVVVPLESRIGEDL